MPNSPTEQAIEAFLDKLQADAYEAGCVGDSMHESDVAYMEAKRGVTALLKEAKVEELMDLGFDKRLADDPILYCYADGTTITRAERIKALQSTEGKET